MYRLLTGDVLSFAGHYKGPQFHALFCDPSYALSNKRNVDLTARANLPNNPTNADVMAAYHSLQQWGDTGFMGKAWDTDIAFNPNTWAALAEHLLPGAFGMAFASSRGWHRLAVAIEDAGLRIHPSIFGWVYGSGFPKSTKIDTQIDFNAPRAGMFESFAHHFTERWQTSGLKRSDFVSHFPHYKNAASIMAQLSNWKLGKNVPTTKDFGILKSLLNLSDKFLPLINRLEAEREVIGKQTKARKSDSGIPLPTTGDTEYQTWDITLPATDLARAWAGHRYGLQAMKPALEPIIVFQKPYSGKPVDSIVETGAGALWIDGGRIGTQEKLTRPERRGVGDVGGWANYEQKPGEYGSKPGQGRWPANFTLGHSPLCERIGTREVKGGSQERGLEQTHARSWKNKSIAGINRTGYANEQGNETIANWRCVPECPVRRLGEQSGERPHSGRHGESGSGERVGIFNMGSIRQATYWDTGTAARFFFQSDFSHEIAERLEQADPVMYQAKAANTEREIGLLGIIPCAKCGRLHSTIHKNEHDKIVTCRRNGHETIKPITLLKWLATLLLPPDTYAPRRILVPFAGTGSEMIAAGLVGWEHIIGIELLSENVSIGKARLKHWLTKPQQLTML